MKKKLMISASHMEDIEILDKYEFVDIVNVEEDIFSGGTLPELKIIAYGSIESKKPIYITIKNNADSYQVTRVELEKMLHIFEIIKSLKIEGIKWSALNSDGTIDEESLKWVIKNKGNLKLIFSRAIDSARDYGEAINTLKKYEKDIEYIATSGGAETAVDGIYNIKMIGENFPNKVMAASRINFSNIDKMMEIDEIIGVHIYKGVLHSQDERVKHSINEEFLEDIIKKYNNI